MQREIQQSVKIGMQQEMQQEMQQAMRKDMQQDIQAHCAAIERCNQRGGRMLSIVDLVRAGTLTPALAACSLAAIGQGASFMVGAQPGGAGKTTVMGALLNCVPVGVPLVTAGDIGVVQQGLHSSAPRCCYICHEIGAGSYYGYLWGEGLRRYFQLASYGHMLATNLHADTYEQAHRQICGDNRVDPGAFRSIRLLYFLQVRRRSGKAERRTASLWVGDGYSDHRQVEPEELDRQDGVDGLVSPAAMQAARQTLTQLMDSGARTIQDVRAWLAGQAPPESTGRNPG